VSYYAVPEAERASRCELGSDYCAIDLASFFARGCLEIPVRGADEPLVWGVWVSISQHDFKTWMMAFEEQHRSHLGPFSGWLNAWFRPYPEAVNLRARVNLRDYGIRPSIQLEPVDHPLALKQHNGISIDRVAEIYAIMTHGPDQ
jgi:hypothetical protein